MKTTIKGLVAAICMAAGVALAQNAVLQNEWVKAGVNQTTGTFGSGGNTSPGLQYDGTGSGTFNAAYDYLTPGSPFDGFTVRLEDGANTLIQSYTNNNAGNQAQIAGALDTNLERAVLAALNLDRQQVKAHSQKWTWDACWHIFRDNLVFTNRAQ